MLTGVRLPSRPSSAWHRKTSAPDTNDSNGLTELVPIVCDLKHIPKTVNEATALLERAHVVVTTSSIDGECAADVQQAIADQCSHLFIDARRIIRKPPTWSAFKGRFMRGMFCKLQRAAMPYATPTWHLGQTEVPAASWKGRSA